VQSVRGNQVAERLHPSALGAGGLPRTCRCLRNVNNEKPISTGCNHPGGKSFRPSSFLSEKNPSSAIYLLTIEYFAVFTAFASFSNGRTYSKSSCAVPLPTDSNVHTSSPGAPAAPESAA